ncbi:hypothetical protein [Alloactinosynnema sp. L-07]|uniref:hypothetical protein n=1 Tax=Alloactinosynnema sp. L-07 TaxID=1653480 RepID=UPI00065EF311|nr:hypothetical protein [Alloactinosynnema sp. L-07]CRK59082.1 hypothetical protein [Alloactinosynnema sp. L-07]
MTNPTNPGPLPARNEVVEDRLARIEQLLREIPRKTLYSASIGAGGLKISDDGSLTVFDSNGVERVFMGSSSFYEGFTQPVVYFRDGNGKLRFAIYDPLPVSDGYQPVVWTFDHLDHVAFTTDKNGGIAEPHLSVPLLQRFRDSTFGSDAPESDPTLPVSALGTLKTCYEGRISKVSHPRIAIDGAWGRVTGGTGVPTYSLRLNGVEVGTWSQTSYTTALKGPYDITDYLGQSNVSVRLQVSATGTGTDRVAVAPYGCWMRQT